MLDLTQTSAAGGFPQLADYLHSVSRHIMRVRLIRKFALALNGVDLSELAVGNEVELPERSANILISAGWAEPLPQKANRPVTGGELLTADEWLALKAVCKGNETSDPAGRRSRKTQ